MYIDKYKKALSLIDEMCEKLQSNKLLIENDEFNISLNNIKHILTQKTFKVAIVGAIKSGKSTMLNAFIGRDLLPNQNAPCTITTTEIFHSSDECKFINKFLVNGECDLIRSNKNFTLEQMFHNDIKEARKNNSHSEILKYSLNTPINGLQTSEYGDVIKNFVLLDTPGPDEISTFNFDVQHIQKISLKELRDSDALIVIFDYQNFMSDINGKILKYIASNENIVERAKNKIFFVINKIDLMNGKDESIEECIQKTKNMIKEYIPIIENPNVYAFSAKQALFARMAKKDFCSQETLNEIDRLYGSAYTEKIEINGVVRNFKLEPYEYADKLLKESRIEIIEREILNCIFLNFAQENLQIGIEKLISINNDIIDSLENDISVINNKYNVSIENFEKIKNDLVNLKNEFMEVLYIPKSSLNILKNSIDAKLDEMSKYLDNMVSGMLPVKNVLESDTREELLYKINVIENNIKESLNVTVNKIQDHIYSESFNTQIEINKNLNEAFRTVGDELNKYINEQIKFKFQIYNFDDICMSNINFNELNIIETQSTIKESENFNASTLSISMAATSVAGSALGGIMGRTIPILETALGAAFGAGIGLAYIYVKKIKSTKVREKVIYSVDVHDFKEMFLNTIRDVFEDMKIEIFKNVDSLIEKSVLSVDKQLSRYVKKLDNRIGRLIKNTKIDKEKKRREVRNLEVFKKEFVDLMYKLDEIKFKTINFGDRNIEINNQVCEQLKHDNILVI